MWRVRDRRAWSGSRRRSDRSWRRGAGSVMGRRNVRAGCGSIRPTAIGAGGDSGPVVLPGKPEREPADRGDRLRGRAEDAAEREAQRRRDRRAHRVGPRGGRLAGCRHAPDRRRTPRPAAGGPLFTEEQKSFWAFQPPRDPVPPDVKAAAGQRRRSIDSSWPSSRKRGSRRHRRPISGP